MRSQPSISGDTPIFSAWGAPATSRVAGRLQQGIENLTDAASEALVGKDCETHQRDLFESIERGDFPRWMLFVRVMTDAQAKAFRFKPFDLTKVWPKAEFPLMEVGYFELNRNPENFFANRA